MYLVLASASASVFASVVNYDSKWRHILERHLLIMLTASFTILICLWYRALNALMVYYFIMIFWSYFRNIRSSHKNMNKNEAKYLKIEFLLCD